MRLTVTEPSIDFRWKRREGSRRPAAHIADLDYADDIALLANTVGSAQHLLTALETNTKTVGLKINVAKTEFMLADDFLGQPVLTTSSAPSSRWMTSGTWDVG